MRGFAGRIVIATLAAGALAAGAVWWTPRAGRGAPSRPAVLSAEQPTAPPPKPQDKRRSQFRVYRIVPTSPDGIAVPPGAEQRTWTVDELASGLWNDGAKLQGTTWAGARLTRVWLWHFDLRGADLSRGRFNEIHLRWCDLTGANLADAYFSDSGMMDSDLSEANLNGADLRGLDLMGVGFTGATYDRQTRWPAGFDPAAHRARLVE